MGLEVRFMLLWKKLYILWLLTEITSVYFVPPQVIELLHPPPLTPPPPPPPIL